MNFQKFLLKNSEDFQNHLDHNILDFHSIHIKYSSPIQIHYLLFHHLLILIFFERFDIVAFLLRTLLILDKSFQYNLPEIWDSIKIQRKCVFH